MQLQEKVGIVLATYNPNLEYFEKQIQSIKNQTWQNWVCHIVDDSSQWQYQTAIKCILAEDPRFVCHLHNNNLNYYHNFERGLHYCANDKKITAICFADQDDIWLPEKLKVSLEELRSQDALLVHSDLEMIDSQDQNIHSSAWNFEGRNPEKLTPELLLLHNVVTGCSLLFCASLLFEILPFPKHPPQTKIGWHHDWWVALVAAHRGKIAHIRQPLVRYRIHAANNVGVVQDAGKLYRELLVWLSKKMKITGNSFFIHSHLSKAYYTRFQQELSPNWFNPFDEKRLDFGLGILNLCYKSWREGYNSEGIGFRIWALKVLYDVQKMKNHFFQS